MQLHTKKRQTRYIKVELKVDFVSDEDTEEEDDDEYGLSLIEGEQWRDMEKSWKHVDKCEFFNMRIVSIVLILFENKFSAQATRPPSIARLVIFRTLLTHTHTHIYIYIYILEWLASIYQKRLSFPEIPSNTCQSGPSKYRISIEFFYWLWERGN